MRLVLPRVRSTANERGIVLAAALLFILLSSVLVLTLMLTTTGERTQSSNVQTAKLSLYAADAGVRTQQQLLANLAKAKIDSCLALWNLTQDPAQPIISNPAQLFPAGTLGGTWAASSTYPSFNASASINFASAGSGPTSQTYDFMFTIVSSGSLMNTGKRNVQSNGVLRVSASRGSFSDYLIMTDQFKAPNNVPGLFTTADNFDGRVHTNDTFRFAYNPTFQDRVTQVSANATYYNNGSPVSVNANNNGVIDVPNFYGGFQRSQPSLALPANSNDQQMASLGLAPNGNPPTATQINTALNVGGGGPHQGAYIVNDHTSLGGGVEGTISGGIYVEGTANRVKVWADTSLDRQYYQVSVGSNHRTIEIDRTNNRTNVWDSNAMGGSPDHVYAG